MKEELKKGRGNGTYSLDGLVWGDSNRVSGVRKPCPICYAVLGHECVMRLYNFEIDGITFSMWICDCFGEEDCGFIYPDGLAEKEIQILAKERQAYLNSLGIGINHAELEKIFTEINQKSTKQIITALERK